MGPICSLTALVQPNQDSNKESTFGAMLPQTSTIPASFMPSGMPGAVFNPVGAQAQQASNDKSTVSGESLDTPNEITLQGQ